MYQPRIIPVLLLKNQGIVKSVKFKNHRYIGDPINSVRLFNDLNADELTFLDILASKNKKSIDVNLVKEIAEEANMPFSVGGGIRDLKMIEKLLKAGTERVVLNSILHMDPTFLEKASKEFGSSTIAVCVDIKKNLFGKNVIYYSNAKKKSPYTIDEFISKVQNEGGGEIIVQSVDKDGTQTGYDDTLNLSISRKSTIPISILGGLNAVSEISILNTKGVFNGYCAGSAFVYHGKRNAILINYPSNKEKEIILSNE